MARPKGSTKNVKTPQKTGAKTGPEAGVNNTGTPGVASEDSPDDTDVEEIATPETATNKPTDDVSKSGKACRLVVKGFSATLYVDLLSKAHLIDEKKPIYKEWQDKMMTAKLIPPGTAKTTMIHFVKELLKKPNKDELELVLEFMLAATKHRGFRKSTLNSSKLYLEKLVKLLVVQKPTGQLLGAIICLLEICPVGFRRALDKAFLDAVPKITSLEVFEEVLPVVLSGKLDFTLDAAITQVQTILTKYQSKSDWTPSEALDLYGENLGEDVKKAILAAFSVQQTLQNEVSSNKSSSRALRDQSSDDDDDDDDSGSHLPDQSSHAQPLTPPQQRSPPNLQGKLTENLTERQSQTLTSVPVDENGDHNDGSPQPSSSLVPLPPPELLRNDRISSGSPGSTLKRCNDTNFNSRQRQPRIINLHSSSPTPRATAAVASRAKLVGNRPQPAADAGSSSFSQASVYTPNPSTVANPLHNLPPAEHPLLPNLPPSLDLTTLLSSSAAQDRPIIYINLLTYGQSHFVVNSDVHGLHTSLPGGGNQMIAEQQLAEQQLDEQQSAEQQLDEQQLDEQQLDEREMVGQDIHDDDDDNPDNLIDYSGMV